jgi:tetratricopeptide (TPR) repeat protein
MGRVGAISALFRSAGVTGCSLAALILFTMLPLFLHAQTAASLHGTIRDAEGKPVAGAAVQLHTTDASLNQTVHTDSLGKFAFPALHGGVYQLRGEMPGLGVAEITALFLGPNEAKNVDLALQPPKTPALSLTQKPEFFDRPQFTVSGVTDTTNLGGHGSDTTLRARETLAKETVSLGKDSAGAVPVANYARERDHLQFLLAHQDTPELHHSLGDVQEKLGNSLEAVREYQRAAELAPSEPYIFDWGSELLLHHAPEPALEVFAKGNRLFPRSARMLIGIGASCFAQGDVGQAVERIAEASDLDPNNSIPYLFLGRMQSAEPTSSEETVEKLRRFVVQQPNNAQANYYYAVGLWKLRKEPQAIAEQVESLLRNAIRLNPQFGAAYLQLGILHSAQKDELRAISDYKQAIQVDSQMEEAHYRLAQAYRQMGDAAKADVELKIYDQIAKESAQKADRERHEIRQFVYTLRDQPPPQIP